MNRKKTIAVKAANQSRTLPVSADGLEYVSYKHSVFSTVISDTAYTMKISVYPDGKVRVAERIGRGKISDQRQYGVSPEAVTGLYESIMDCINNKHPYDLAFSDGCTGKLTLHYKDRNVRVDRGTHDTLNGVCLGDLVVQFLAENGVGWDISEEGLQMVREMEEQRRFD